MRPTVDEYFMDAARLVASRSTCVRRSVGCVLVNARNHVLATGYNGVAAGEAHCNEPVVNAHPHYLEVGTASGAGVDLVETCAGREHRRIHFPYACEGANSESGKNLDACLAIHAEQNAVLQCTDAYAIDRAYVTAFPCPTCAKLLLNTSCREVVYDQPYGDGAGLRIWLAGGRLARRLGGEPHMIQADLVTLFGRDRWIEWRVAVACVCLNLASARVARGIVFRVLQRWPDPATMSRAGADLERLLHPLGLSQRRAGYLRGMAECAVRGVDPEVWPGVGQYAWDSVRVFCRGELLEGVGDRKVRAYVEWKKSQASKV